MVPFFELESWEGDVAASSHSSFGNSPHTTVTGLRMLLAILITLLLGGFSAGSIEARPSGGAPSNVPVKVYGANSAPITFEVFTDYECPTCRALFEQTLRPMIADYVASGKVRIIHRDYPLAPPLHHYSGQAARWANAAACLGLFEPVEAALYDNQPAWAASGDIEKYVASALSTEDFKRVQRLMQGCVAPGPTSTIDGINFSPSRAACSLDTYVEQDISLGHKVRVAGTPTFIISCRGRQLPAASGMVSWPILKQFFDSLLKS